MPGHASAHEVNLCEQGKKSMSSTDKPEIRVAVIGVHGVGDQEPHLTAQGLADLLASFSRQSADVQYGPFCEETCDIPVKAPIEKERFEPGATDAAAEAPGRDAAVGGES